jgi:hypothetical protein
LKSPHKKGRRVAGAPRLGVTPLYNQPVFVDELNLHVKAGHGGEGLIHFAKRKYQPFGGPDGGDGGIGGDVVMVGSRSVDSLEALRYFEARAEHGKPGEKNLRAGANAPHLQIAVPPGTLASYVQTGGEIGSVKSTKDKLILARGGKGGRGNPHFSTATNRAPKKSQPGEPGEEHAIELRYRIYAETFLIEPSELSESLVLPQLLERDVTDIDYDLYKRKPRWIRAQHNFKLFDLGLLTLEHDSKGKAIVIHGPHVFWGKHLFFNLTSVEDAGAVWESLQPWLNSVELRQAELITVASPEQLFHPWTLESERGGAKVESIAIDSPSALLAAFQTQLTGGTVE